MVDSEEYFPSRFLTGNDIKPRQNATVIDVKEEMVGQDEQATKILVIYFKEFEKGLKVNATINKSMIEFAGSSNTDKWINTTVGLVAVNQPYMGKIYNVVRLVIPWPKS